jgi:hypothetical protein
VAEISFDRFVRGMAEGIQGQRGEWSAAGLTMLGLALIGLAALGAAGYYWFMARRRRTTSATRAALFEKLCEAHRLTAGEIALLEEVVRTDRMPLPPRLFLEPERFDATRRSGTLAQRGAELTALRAKLFVGAE